MTHLYKKWLFLSILLCLLITSICATILTFLVFQTVEMTHVTNESDFFVVLPSNSSAIYFPNNKPQSYKVKLVRPISLQGNWEVALAEIFYQRTWKNVKSTGSELTTSPHQYIDVATPDSNWTFLIPVRIRSGHYRMPQTLIMEINDAMNRMKDLENNVKFVYDEISNHCRIECSKDYRFQTPAGEELRKLLGFTVEDLVKPGLVKTAKYPVDIQRGFHTMYIYTDIISPVLVGDAFVPLLKIIPVKDSYGEIVHMSFDRMHYTPLRSSHIDTVEINISDDAGELVPFTYGKTIVKLHFRPRKPAFL